MVSRNAQCAVHGSVWRWWRCVQYYTVQFWRCNQFSKFHSLQCSRTQQMSRVPNRLHTRPNLMAVAVIFSSPIIVRARFTQSGDLTQTRAFDLNVCSLLGMVAPETKSKSMWLLSLAVSWCSANWYQLHVHVSTVKICGHFFRQSICIAPYTAYSSNWKSMKLWKRENLINVAVVLALYAGRERKPKK